MSESIKRFLYFIYFIIKRPFVSLNNKLVKLEKPRLFLRTMLFLTACSLYLPTLMKLEISFNIIFQVLLLFSIVLYIWKYGSKECGRIWLKEYNERRYSPTNFIERLIFNER